MKFDEELQRKVEIISKIVTTLALVFGGFWTVTQYFNQRQAELSNRELETRKQFLQTRFNSCLDVTNAAAVIAVSDDPKEIVDAKKKFQVYFWGPMKMVDDKDIYSGMIEFASCLTPDKCADPKAAATELARRCRKSLGGSWDVIPVPPIGPRELKAVVR